MNKFYLRYVIAFLILILSGASTSIFSQLINSVPVQTAIVGEQYVYDVNVFPLGDSVFYLNEGPDNMIINPSNGLITWTPASINEGGQVIVRVTVGTYSDTISYYVYVSPDIAICDEFMVSYWKLDETSGTTYEDFKGGYDAITGVAPDDIPGVIGRAKDFDPARDVRLTIIDSDDQYDWDQGQDISASLWFNSAHDITSVDQAQVFIGRLGASASVSNGHWWWFGLDTNNYVHVTLTNDEGMGTFPDNLNYLEGFSRSGTHYQNGDWHHAVFTLDGNASNFYTLKIYVDGELHRTVTKTFLAGGFNSESTLNVGWWENPWGSTNFEFDGSLDEIALYKRTLSAQEISEIYQEGLAKKPYCRPGNYAPLFKSESQVNSVLEDTEYSYIITTGDYDTGDSLTIFPENVPDWFSDLIDNGNGTAVISGMPENSDVGNHLIILGVSDGKDSVYQSFDLEVINVNDLPEFTTNPIISAAADSPYQYWVSVRDDEDGFPFCEAIVIPSWLSFSYNESIGTGSLQGTPSASDPLLSNVSLKVTDNDGESRTQAFVINVQGGFTSIEGNSETNKVLVYPSPAKDFVIIKTDGQHENAYVQLLTNSGVKIGEYQLKNHEVSMDMSGLKSGLYFYKIIASEGKEIVGKIIKE